MKAESRKAIVSAVAILLLSPAACCPASAYSQTKPAISVDWSGPALVSATVPTLMVEANPLLREKHALGEVGMKAIRSLNTRYVRFHGQSFWPRLVVAELEPPTRSSTSWDFTTMDSLVVPFLEATKGHEPILNFNTVPAWMFKTANPVTYPADPDESTRTYADGTELVDPSGLQLAEYFARIVSWYSQGGFTDEVGRYHRSGYHYELPWWNVLNEVQTEHQILPEQYVVCYDAIVTAIRKVSPKTRFIGLSLASMGRWSGSTDPSHVANYLEYFLNAKNHRAGIPLDMVSFHFYAAASPRQSLETWQYGFFDQAEGFVNVVDLIEATRRRLSPSTGIYLGEVGAILPTYSLPASDLSPASVTPARYWNLSGALFAYLYIEMTKRGIEGIAASQLLGDPQDDLPADTPGSDSYFYDSLAMIDAKTGKANARYWALSLLTQHLGPGDRLVPTKFGELNGVVPDIAAQGFVTTRGKRLLIINKRDTDLDVQIGPESAAEHVDCVDTVVDGPRRVRPNARESLRLAPFAVCIVTVA